MKEWNFGKENSTVTRKMAFLDPCLYKTFHCFGVQNSAVTFVRLLSCSLYIGDETVSKDDFLLDCCAV
jgi:hypothetical protein